MKIEHSDSSIAVIFNYALKTLSAAALHGGFSRADTIVNLRTTADEVENNNPENLISDFLKKEYPNRKGIVLLTSAYMKYTQFVLLHENDLKVLAIVTAGTSNALNISERSDTHFTGTPITAGGTINTIVITNAHLLDDCMVSSVITATEAKTAALYDLKIKSVLTGSQATGTGTDSIVIVSGNDMTIQYAGGHTLFGQLIGEAVYTAVKRSVSKRITKFTNFDEIYHSFSF